MEPQIQKSTAPPFEIGTGFGYRSHSYAKALVRLETSNKLETVCIDSGCSANLLDEHFLKRQDPQGKLQIRVVARSLTVEGIGSAHSSDEYVIARIHLPGRLIKGEFNAEAVITRELHLVKNLKANLLIGTDILVPEQCDIFTTKKILRINTCGVDVPIIVKANSVYSRPVYVMDDTTIAPGTRRVIPIQNFCVVNQDYLYEPIQLDHLHAFAHIINVKTVGV
ncbi:hypothetical protein K3495_g5987 [Podosphaera aphanis]|nr:hypothetical protein K3495_g5987 [Podosphaera aphanis]